LAGRAALQITTEETITLNHFCLAAVPEFFTERKWLIDDSRFHQNQIQADQFKVN
jgi:hypothetical protein